jgi:hypothetical protein
MVTAGSPYNADRVIQLGLLPRLMELMQMDEHRARIDMLSNYLALLVCGQYVEYSVRGSVGSY